MKTLVSAALLALVAGTASAQLWPTDPYGPLRPAEPTRCTSEPTFGGGWRTTCY